MTDKTAGILTENLRHLINRHHCIISPFLHLWLIASIKGLMSKPPKGLLKLLRVWLPIQEARDPCCTPWALACGLNIQCSHSLSVNWNVATTLQPRKAVIPEKLWRQWTDSLTLVDLSRIIPKDALSQTLSIEGFMALQNEVQRQSGLSNVDGFLHSLLHHSGQLLLGNNSQELNWSNLCK